MPNTPNNQIPFVPENTIDPAAGLNLSLVTIDALLQLVVETVGDNAPPGTPADGARHIVGTAPSGAWVGEANRLAVYVADGAFWRFYDAALALNNANGAMYTFTGGSWSELTASGAVATLAALDDVNTGGVTDGQTLVYNATAGEWQVGDAASGGGASSLGELSDVDTTGVADGDLLGFDLANGRWQPYTLSLASTFLGLTDTPADYTGAANQLVAVNGAGNGLTFIDASSGGIPDAPSDGKLYGRQNGQWVEITQAAIDGGAVWDGMLYLVDDYGYVEAVDGSGPTSSWQNLDGYNGTGDFYRAAVNDTKVFAFDSNGVVWLFNKSTGTFVSSFDALMGFPAGIAAADGSDTLYVVSQNATNVAAFDSGGNSLWTFPLPQNTADGNSEYGVSLALAGGYLYVVSGVDAPGIDYLFKLDPADGSQVWAAPSSGTSAYACGLAMGPSDSVYVYIGEDDGTGVVQDVLRKYDSAGTLLWSSPLGQYFSNEVKMTVDDDGTCYSVNNQYDGTTYNSTLILRVDTNGTLVDNTQQAVSLSGIEARGGVVYVMEANDTNYEHHLVARNAADWAELWRLPILDGTYGRPVQAIVSYTA